MQLRDTLAIISLAFAVGAFGLSAVAVLRDAPEPAPALVTPEQVRSALLARPETLPEVARVLQTKQEASQRKASVEVVAANRAELFEGFGLVLGNPNGSKVVVEFQDYQCGYCRKAHPLLEQVIAANSDLKVIVKELPILGPASFEAAKAAVAADMQGKYLEMHKALIKQSLPLNEEKILAAANEAGVDVERLRADLESPEVLGKIHASMNTAQKLGITGTPTFAALGAGILSGFGDIKRFEAYVAAVEKP